MPQGHFFTPSEDDKVEKLRELIECEGKVLMPVMRRRTGLCKPEVVAIGKAFEKRGLIVRRKVPPQCKGGHYLWEFEWTGARKEQRDETPVAIASN